MFILRLNHELEYSKLLLTFKNGLLIDHLKRQSLGRGRQKKAGPLPGHSIGTLSLTFSTAIAIYLLKQVHSRRCLMMETTVSCRAAPRV